MFQPVAIDALANWSSRTSRWERNTEASGSSPRQCRTNTRSLPICVRRSASAGWSSAACSSGMNRPEWSSIPLWTSSATASTRPEPHIPTRLDVADHLERQLIAVDSDAFDRAVGGAHPALDLRGLERRSSRRRGGQHPLGRAERDLAVRADVDEQAQPAVARQAGREHPGDDVAADVGAERGEHERRRPGVRPRRRTRTRVPAGRCGWRR